MFQIIKDFVLQDVKNENETKKVAVILRINSITMCIYFLVLTGTFFITGEIRSAILCIPCFAAYVIAFFTTYLNMTKAAAVFVQLLMGGWIIGFVMEFGWDCGVQHFIFVLLVLNFVTSYRKIGIKIVMGVSLGIFRLLLYGYTSLQLPGYILDRHSSMTFQIINTVFIFVAIISILAVFTEDAQEMEKKLLIYNEKLHKQASQDPLTGLRNRRSMREFLEKKETECREGKIDNLSLALGDIDYFKKVNDTYGHECGDIVLRQLASVFKEVVGEKGEISRWGGEEFLFVFNNVNGDEALVILGELQKRMKKMEIPYKDEIIKITMTFGLSEFDFHRGRDYSINDVDAKLYKGKEAGRNRVIY